MLLSSKTQIRSSSCLDCSSLAFDPFAMTSAFAEDQIVKINGAIISGQIVSEDGDAVVLSIRGIELRIPNLRSGKLSGMKKTLRHQPAVRNQAHPPLWWRCPNQRPPTNGNANGRVGQPGSTGRRHPGGSKAENKLAPTSSPRSMKP